MGILKADYVPGKFYNGKLHAKTQTQERNTMFAGIADRSDFAVDSPVAETARNQDSGHIRKKPAGIFRSYGLRVDPLNFHIGAVCHTAVL